MSYKKQLAERNREQLHKLIQLAGDISFLATMLDVHYMVVKGWKERGRVSKDGAKLVEQHPELGKHFSAKDLRPDLY